MEDKGERIPSEPGALASTAEWAVRCSLPRGLETWHPALFLAYLEQDNKVGQAQACCPLPSNFATPLPASRPSCFHPGFQPFSALNTCCTPGAVPSTRQQAAGRALSAPGDSLERAGPLLLYSVSFAMNPHDSSVQPLRCCPSQPWR